MDTVTTPFLHCDLDAFYASVEQLLDPRLRGRPVAVGGGVILAASYEARAYGVNAPMGIRQAKSLCPDLRVVAGSFRRYVELSKRVMDVLGDATPLLEQVSIDEAFLDVSGSVHLLGSPSEIGATIRRRVRDEIGLSISVGAASTKFLAKVASGQAKPDGMEVIEPVREIEWLHRLPVRVMWGVGPVTERRLAEQGLRSVGDVAATPADTLSRWLGPGAGHHLHALAWNRDPRSVSTAGRSGSVGAQSALGGGLTDPDELGRVLLSLADRVASRMQRGHRAGRRITVRVRFEDLRAVTRSVTLPAPVESTAAIHHTALPLLADARLARRGPVTLIGISVSRLEPAGPLQLELPFDQGDVTRSGSPAGAAQIMVDTQIARARARFGAHAVGRASALLDRRKGVPDEFRELAERDRR